MPQKNLKNQNFSRKYTENIPVLSECSVSKLITTVEFGKIGNIMYVNKSRRAPFTFFSAKRHFRKKEISKNSSFFKKMFCAF